MSTQNLKFFYFFKIKNILVLFSQKGGDYITFIKNRILLPFPFALIFAIKQKEKIRIITSLLFLLPYRTLLKSYTFSILNNFAFTFLKISIQLKILRLRLRTSFKFYTLNRSRYGNYRCAGVYRPTACFSILSKGCGRYRNLTCNRCECSGCFIISVVGG